MGINSLGHLRAEQFLGRGLAQCLPSAMGGGGGRSVGREGVCGSDCSYSAILKEITTKGKESRFKKTDRGRFART